MIASFVQFTSEALSANPPFIATFKCGFVLLDLLFAVCCPFTLVNVLFVLRFKTFDCLFDILKFFLYSLSFRSMTNIKLAMYIFSFTMVSWRKRWCTRRYMGMVLNWKTIFCLDWNPCQPYNLYQDQDCLRIWKKTWLSLGWRWLCRSLWIYLWGKVWWGNAWLG